jgi:hypothetical protein
LHEYSYGRFWTGTGLKVGLGSVLVARLTKGRVEL